VSILWAYLQFRVIVWLLRTAGRLLAFAALAAVLVAAAPVTLVAAVGLTGAWLRGWPPARLWRTSAWALPMTAVYVAGRAVQAARGGAWRWPRCTTMRGPGMMPVWAGW